MGKTMIVLGPLKFLVKTLKSLLLTDITIYGLKDIVMNTDLVYTLT